VRRKGGNGDRGRDEKGKGQEMERGKDVREVSEREMRRTSCT